MGDRQVQGGEAQRGGAPGLEQWCGREGSDSSQASQSRVQARCKCSQLAMEPERPQPHAVTHYISGQIQQWSFPTAGCPLTFGNELLASG